MGAPGLGTAEVDRRRNQTVELLRIAACSVIVAYHAGAMSWRWGHGAVMVFVMLLAYFEAASPRPFGLRTAAAKLLAPWAGAMIVYGGMNLLRHKPLLADAGLIPGVLYGPSPHLWFLPFAFVVVAVIGVMKRWPRAMFALSAALSIAMLWCVRRFIHDPMPQFLLQWLLSAAPAFVGIALARTPVRGRWTLPLAATVAAGLYLSAPGIGILYCVTFCLVLAALRFPGPVNARWLSRHVYGIYLVHPAVLALGHALGLKGWADALSAFAFSAALVAGAWALAQRLHRPTAHTPAPASVNWQA